MNVKTQITKLKSSLDIITLKEAKERGLFISSDLRIYSDDIIGIIEPIDYIDKFSFKPITMNINNTKHLIMFDNERTWAENEIILIMKDYLKRIEQLTEQLDKCEDIITEKEIITERGTLYTCIYDLNEVLDFPVVLKPITD